MTREEKQKAVDALKISAPVMAMTQEEFNDYIQTINQIMDWLGQESCEDTAFWEWVPYDDDEHGDIVCSKCRAVEVECVWKYTAWAEIERIKYKHCPQCGAKITESEDKE